MHRQDTDQRRMFSYADFEPGPSTDPGPSTGPPGPLGSKFQDSQLPDTPMTSQQIEALLPRRSARLQQRPSQPGSSSHDDSDYDPKDDHNTWIAGNTKRPRWTYDHTPSDDSDEDYSEHEPIKKSPWV
ncbi:hypothetical protein JCGZ_02404 [Jatropha curcas]|uniref:Uncharacterized protein n=1 Tax=Jatropha curcas TaxID=180498 RepID=A0A067LHV3_JATCU|nr:hypothetical protein JCGZ_02404 [Jatropha curcas]